MNPVWNINVCSTDWRKLNRKKNGPLRLGGEISNFNYLEENLILELEKELNVRLKIKDP